MKQFDTARDWYLGLEARERKIVTGGGIALALIVLWLVIVSPWLTATAELRAEVRADTQLIAWMRQAAAEIDQLRKTAPAKSGDSEQSLFSTVERTARQSPVGGDITQFQPRPPDAVQVHLEATPFDAMIVWLGRLQATHGVLVTSLGIQRAEAPGRVTADITLERPSS